jgi:hypothetical protein
MSLTVPLYGFGGGGESLNFKVVGDTTEPTNPNENTIWVNTDKKIASWIFSATQPKTATEGMVWISTGTASTAEFNVLKKNGVFVYPISAKQRIGGAWIDKTAKSYQNGEWSNWGHYLFESGKGFSYPTAQYRDKNATITIENDRISFYAIGTSSNGFIGNVLNIGPVDMTDYTKLCVDMEYLKADTAFPDWQPAIGVSKTKWTDFDKHLTTDCVKFNAETFERKKVTLPIESYSGEMYFVWNGSGEANIYNIWMERGGINENNLY